MPSPPLPDEVHIETISLVEECLRLGGRPYGTFGPGRSAVSMASELAVERGLTKTRSAFSTRYKSAISAGFAPDESLWSPARYQQPLPKAIIKPAREPDPEAYSLSSDGQTVLFIPDLHQDPRHPDRIDCLKWIARFGAERNIPRVVQLGDWSTFDSVSAHDRNETHKAKVKPTIHDDMSNLEASHAAWLKARGDWKPKQLCTTGNHEYRVERFENVTPEAHGTFTAQRDNIFVSFGWRIAPYSEMRYIEGVGVVHHPVNGAGRAFGGKTGATRAANEASCSLVYGHTHNWKFWSQAKIGAVGGVDILEAGCALPWGVIEHYALTSTNDWWWGVTIAHLQGGRIHDVERVSMLTLRSKYSDDGG